MKSDTKIIEKKLEQRNQKYDDIEHPKELDKLEARCKEIKNNLDDDFKAEIWTEIYKDVLELEKKADTKKSEKKQRPNK